MRPLASDKHRVPVVWHYCLESSQKQKNYPCRDIGLWTTFDTIPGGVCSRQKLTRSTTQCQSQQLCLLMITTVTLLDVCLYVMLEDDKEYHRKLFIFSLRHMFKPKFVTHSDTKYWVSNGFWPPFQIGRLQQFGSLSKVFFATLVIISHQLMAGLKAFFFTPIWRPFSSLLFESLHFQKWHNVWGIYHHDDVSYKQSQFDG